MKKMILILFLLIKIKVNAASYYTDYELIQKESELKFNESDVLYNEEIIKYPIYKLVKSNEDYYEYNKNPKELEYVDLNNSVTDYKYYKNPGLNTSNLVVGKLTKIKKVRYVKLRDFVMSNALINNIKVLYNDKEIDYTFISDIPYNKILNKDDEIIIDLNSKYDFDKLEVIIQINEESLTRTAFMLHFYETGYVNGNKNIYLTIDPKRTKTKEIITAKFLPENMYLDLLKNIEFINDYTAKSISVYIEKIIKYQYYNLIKEYTGDYSLINDKLLIDNELPKSFYNIYQRKKITLNDELTCIENLNDIIIDSKNINPSEIELTLYEKNTNKNDGIILVKYQNYEFYHKINIKEINDSFEVFPILNKNKIEIEDIINRLNIDEIQEIKENTNITEIKEIKEDKNIKKTKEVKKSINTNQVENKKTTTTSKIITTKEDTIKICYKNCKKCNNSRLIIIIIFLFLIIIMELIYIFMIKRKSSFVESV